MNTPVVWSIAIKAKCIDLGLYKPARWLFDNIIDQKKRQLQRTRVNLFRSIIRPGDLCFDIGANKGDYTSALLEAGARVVAVEPQPSCIRELSARFNGNNRVCVIPTALGADCGTETFYVRKISGHSGLVKDWIGTDVVS